MPNIAEEAAVFSLLKDVGTALGKIDGLGRQMSGIETGLKGQIGEINTELRVIKHDKQAIEALMQQLQRGQEVSGAAVERLVAAQARDEKRIDALEMLAHRAAGAWWVLIVVASAIGALGSITIPLWQWLWTHVSLRPPQG